MASEAQMIGYGLLPIISRDFRSPKGAFKLVKCSLRTTYSAVLVVRNNLAAGVSGWDRFGQESPSSK